MLKRIGSFNWITPSFAGYYQCLQSKLLSRLFTATNLSKPTMTANLCLSNHSVADFTAILVRIAESNSTSRLRQRLHEGLGSTYPHLLVFPSCQDILSLSAKTASQSAQLSLHGWCVEIPHTIEICSHDRTRTCIMRLFLLTP